MSTDISTFLVNLETVLDTYIICDTDLIFFKNITYIMILIEPVMGDNSTDL